MEILFLIFFFFESTFDFFNLFVYFFANYFLVDPLFIFDFFFGSCISFEILVLFVSLFFDFKSLVEIQAK